MEDPEILEVALKEVEVVEVEEVAQPKETSGFQKNYLLQDKMNMDLQTEPQACFFG